MDDSSPFSLFCMIFLSSNGFMYDCLQNCMISIVTITAIVSLLGGKSWDKVHSRDKLFVILK